MNGKKVAEVGVVEVGCVGVGVGVDARGVVGGKMAEVEHGAVCTAVCYAAAAVAVFGRGARALNGM
jgi:hypothetical protein